MMRMRILFVVSLFVVGCASKPEASGPTTDEVSRAVDVAWGAALGMEPGALPRFDWVIDGGCHATEWQGNTVAVPGQCEIAFVDSDGNARVEWTTGARFSTTGFPSVLGKWKGYLMTGVVRTTQQTLNDEATARAALASAGL